MGHKPLLALPAYELTQGNTPLLISMPHSGLNLLPDVDAALSDKARKLPDTDWYLPQLYDFLPEVGVGRIKANYTRYVIDLNRPADDKPLYQSNTTGLFPDILFDGSPVFQDGKAPGDGLKNRCKEQIWQPYHNAIEQELARIKDRFGYAVLFDAHSIAAEVPMLFAGTLADFNWGTNNGQACNIQLTSALQNTVAPQYSQVTNGRFKGGYITRHFGRPNNQIHAIQLELSQATYLDDDCLKRGDYQLSLTKGPVIQQQLQDIIKGLLTTCLELDLKPS